MLAGTVTNVAAIVDPNTRSVAARVTVNNPGEVLKKQMYLRVRIHPRQQEMGMLIPVSAVRRDDENLPFVYVQAEAGKFGQRLVKLGSRQGDSTEILDGLKEGEPVIAQGSVFLQFANTYQQSTP